MYVEIWEYRNTVRPRFGQNVTDLEGYKVEAMDGSIGKVDEATEELGSSAVVVDTGPWIFGRKVVIPAGVIERVDPDKKVVHVSMPKDEIKHSPEFDADTGWRNDEYRGRLGSYYGDRIAS